LTAIIFLLSSNTVSAGFLEELNRTYVTDVSELPHYNESELKPDISMTTAEHLQGGIDIVGFEKWQISVEHSLSTVILQQMP
jgi:hypothetical protein